MPSDNLDFDDSAYTAYCSSLPELIQLQSQQGATAMVLPSITSAQSGPPPSLLLDALPTEIQDLIFDYVVSGSSREELKRFRQSNRYFRDRADIHLFRTLHVSASTLSLARIRAISERPRLAAHVRELVYHRGTFSGHKLVHFRRGGASPRDYGDFEEYMVRDGRVDLMRVSSCFAAFSEEVGAESEFNREMSWQGQMRGYCASFKNLEALRTVGGEEDLSSEYLRRRCGVQQQSWTPNYFAPYEVFGACGREWMARALVFDAVNGEDLAAMVGGIRGGDGAVRERFRKLQKLRVSFSETVANLPVLGTYDVFMASCTGLKSLSLDFEVFFSPKVMKDSESLPQKLMGLALKTKFERLGDLELVFPFMTEGDFLAFLREHAGTLRNVTVNRWTMPVTSTGQPTGSVIRALWAIGQIEFRYLDGIVVEGECSSSKTGDGWTIRNENDEWSWATRMHRYLNCRDPYARNFPIHLDLKKMLEAKTGSELEAIDERPSMLGCCDHSFAWSGNKAVSDIRRGLHNMEPWE